MVSAVSRWKESIQPFEDWWESYRKTKLIII
jgi:hypothetical protein